MKISIQCYSHRISRLIYLLPQAHPRSCQDDKDEETGGEDYRGSDILCQLREH